MADEKDELVSGSSIESNESFEEKIARIQAILNKQKDEVQGRADGEPFQEAPELTERALETSEPVRISEPIVAPEKTSADKSKIEIPEALSKPENPHSFKEYFGKGLSSSSKIAQDKTKVTGEVSEAFELLINLASSTAPSLTVTTGESESTNGVEKRGQSETSESFASLHSESTHANKDSGRSTPPIFLGGHILPTESETERTDSKSESSTTPVFLGRPVLSAGNVIEKVEDHSSRSETPHSEPPTVSINSTVSATSNEVPVSTAIFKTETQKEVVAPIKKESATYQSNTAKESHSTLGGNKNKKSKAPIIITALVFLAIVGGVSLYEINSSHQNTPAPSSSSTTSSTSASTKESSSSSVSSTSSSSSSVSSSSSSKPSTSQSSQPSASASAAPVSPRQAQINSVSSAVGLGTPLDPNYTGPAVWPYGWTSQTAILALKRAGVYVGPNPKFIPATPSVVNIYQENGQFVASVHTNGNIQPK